MKKTTRIHLAVFAALLFGPVILAAIMILLAGAMGGGAPAFVGFQNYLRLFLFNPILWRTLMSIFAPMLFLPLICCGAAFYASMALAKLKRPALYIVGGVCAALGGSLTVWAAAASVSVRAYMDLLRFEGWLHLKGTLLYGSILRPAALCAFLIALFAAGRVWRARGAWVLPGALYLGAALSAFSSRIILLPPLWMSEWRALYGTTTLIYLFLTFEIAVLCAFALWLLLIERPQRRDAGDEPASDQ